MSATDVNESTTLQNSAYDDLMDTEELKNVDKRRKSTKFDLPIALHRDLILEWKKADNARYDVHERNARRSSFGLRGVQTSEITVSPSRFADLNPKFLLSRLAMKQNFEFVKKLAFAKIQRHIFDMLKIIYNCQMCIPHESHADDEIPNRLFSWNADDFVERRKLDTLWMDIYKARISSKCFEKQKTKFDLEELRKHLIMIFNGLMGRHTDSKIHSTLIASVKLLDIKETLTAELESNKATMVKLKENINILNMSFNPKLDEMSTLQDIIMNSDVWDPIELRYQLGYYQNKVNQHQEKFDLMDAKLTTEKEELTVYNSREAYCSQCSLNMYYTEIEKFKNRIALLSAKYDKEYDAVENHHTYMKMSMDKLRDQRKYCNEQLIRFREELEQLRLRKIFEEELTAEKALLHQKKLEAAALKKLKKELKRLKKAKK